MMFNKKTNEEKKIQLKKKEMKKSKFNYNHLGFFFQTLP